MEPQEERSEALSERELEGETAQTLPDREAMSTIGLDLSGVGNFAMPINEALAVNNESVQSVAYADADQTVIVGQVDAPVPEEGA
jgi:hypothetical protein